MRHRAFLCLGGALLSGAVMLTRVHLTRAEEAASVIITAVRVNSSKEYVEITNVAAGS